LLLVAADAVHEAVQVAGGELPAERPCGLVVPATKPGADTRPAPAEALDRLAETTRASGTDWALGIEARSRALLSMDQAAEDLYRDAPPQPHWPAH
jgi:hypothetical protein